MIRRGWNWLRALAGRRRLEHEMAEEMQVHISLRAADLERQGLSAAEAWRRARAEFGPEQGIREEAREALGLRLWDELRGDLRYAGRTLRHAPGYAAAAITTLGLGIGATVAIFSAANALFFRPLPFADPDRLVHLYETNPEFNWTDAHAAPANVFDWRERVAAFQDVAFYSDFTSRVPFQREGDPVLLRGAQVSGNFFSVLGVPAALGRTFEWEENFQGGPPTVVLSDAAWRTHFGADPRIIGRSVEIGPGAIEVIGVMPPDFRFPAEGVDLWVTWRWTPAATQAVSFRRAHYVRPIARLAPGVSVAQADAALQAVVRQLQQEYPATNRVMGAGLMPARDFLIRHSRRPLVILLGAVALLLLLACANVANLTLVRALDRGPEFALRQALGAGGTRVARQLLTESVLLALLGGAVGLVLGWLGVRLMSSLTPLGIAGATAIALDGRVVGVTLATALLSGVLFGLAPLMRARRTRPAADLVSGGRQGAAPPHRARAARVLMAAEVALALSLVAGAGLMLRSVWLLRQVDPGFRADGVLAVQFAVPAQRYPARDNVLTFYDQLAVALESRPGIRRVGTVGQLPLAGTSWSSQFKAAGWPEERVGLEILHRRADPGYFEALGIPLVRGRMFDGRDRPDGPFAVVVNETFAREHFPGEDPIGQRIAYDRVPDSTSLWYEIVGIVGDQQQVSPGQPARAEVFENRNQDWGRNNWVVVHAEGDPAATLETVRGALRELDPRIPIAESRTLREVWRDSMTRESFILALLGVFGVVALILAAVGVYGVTAQGVRRRTRELGIRLALGAEPGALRRMIMIQSMTVVAVGLGAGLVALLAAGRSLRAVLFGIAPDDPPTLGAVVVVLVAAAAVACYLPARRATSLAPTTVLRDG